MASPKALGRHDTPLLSAKPLTMLATCVEWFDRGAIPLPSLSII